MPLFGKLDFNYDPYDTDWTPLEEILNSLNDLVTAGKIRHVGLSNETPWGTMKFLQTSKEKNHQIQKLLLGKNVDY